MNTIGTIDRMVRTLAALLAGSLLGVAAPPSLSDFPKVGRIWMGMEEGTIRPAAYMQFRTSAAGYVALHAGDGDALEKSQHWATLDPDQLEIERKTLQLEVTKLDRKLKDSLKTHREAQLRLQLELDETRQKRQELLNASETPEYAALLGNQMKTAIAKIDERIKLLEEQLDPVSFDESYRVEKEDGDLQIERKQKQLESLEKHSQLRAKFPGVLRLTEELKRQSEESREPNGMVWIEANEPLATIVDDSKYEIVINATSPLLSQIPQQELLVFLQESQTGRLIEGHYQRTEEVDSGSEIQKTYIFSIPEHLASQARHSMGQRNLIHVYRKFPSEHTIVYKKDIAFLAPEVLETAGWDGLVRHLWPGSQVMQVGPQTIAVQARE